MASRVAPSPRSPGALEARPMYHGPDGVDAGGAKAAPQSKTDSNQVGSAPRTTGLRRGEVNKSPGGEMLHLVGWGNMNPSRWRDNVASTGGGMAEIHGGVLYLGCSRKQLEANLWRSQCDFLFIASHECVVGYLGKRGLLLNQAEAKNFAAHSIKTRLSGLYDQQSSQNPGLFEAVAVPYQE